MSTRRGGVSPEPFGMNLSFRVGDDPRNVEENRRRFFTMAGADPHEVAIPLQCHSDIIQVVNRPGEYQSCDGLVTATTGLSLVVSVADCLPVALYDPEISVIGLVHAGWRGTARRIVMNAITIMEKEFGASPGRMVAYLGPSAGVCCYEVGPEVAREFALECVERRGGTIYLNLKRANTDHLHSSGLKTENIEVSDSCTICGGDEFHSYRRDGNRSGRMMALFRIAAGGDQ
jgi:YfiH family protein